MMDVEIEENKNKINNKINIICFRCVKCNICGNEPNNSHNNL